jgi:tetratricopeptide (TPR) repeat protein
MAELLAAEGKFDEAAALFQKGNARAPKPELHQALGELYLFAHQPGKAEPWLDKAGEAFLQSVECGDVHYFHHLADFYADARCQPDEAVRLRGWIWR